MNTDELRGILRAETADELDEIGRSATASATQAAVWHDGEVVFSEATGLGEFGRNGRRIGLDTPFDVASLTKPLVTGTLLMQAVDEQLCDWDDPVDAHLGDWSADDFAESVTLRQLADHTSGLPDWKPLYESLELRPEASQVTDNRRRILSRIHQTPFAYRPGTDEIYSDLGYIVLGCLLEQLFEKPLDAAARERIFEPLEMDCTRFVSAAVGGTAIEAAPATECDDLRDGLVCGTVHDRNAAAFGGVAGHAGAFSTAEDLADFGAHLLAVDRDEAAESTIVSRESLRYAWSEPLDAPDGHHLIGWDTPSGQRSSAGRGLHAGRTVGHLGFTGTSIWMERDRNLVAVLLTNRVYPSRDNDRIEQLRIRFHEAVVPPP